MDVEIYRKNYCMLQ